MTLTLMAVKPKSFSHFSPPPLVHSFDPLLHSTRSLHTLSQEGVGAGGGVKEVGVKMIALNCHVIDYLDIHNNELVYRRTQ